MKFNKRWVDFPIKFQVLGWLDIQIFLFTGDYYLCYIIAFMAFLRVEFSILEMILIAFP